MKTCTRLNTFALGIITCITAQNTQCFKKSYPLEQDILQAQLDCILNDIIPDAIKIGMVPSQSAAKTIAECLANHKTKHIIVDPILSPSLDGTLGKEDAIAELSNGLLDYLIPMATLVTPNLEELKSLENILNAPLLSITKSVLLKGGHSQGENLRDMIIYPEKGKEKIVLESKRIATDNLHGTGCMYSTSIAAHLALGHNLEDSIKRSHKFVKQAILAGKDYQLGKKKGYGPLNFFSATGRPEE